VTEESLSLDGIDLDVVGDPAVAEDWMSLSGK
jgi:hypothetical protein